MISKIISGGQTGADRAALDVAIELGIPHGGWIPKGRKTEDGRLPEKYRLKEMPTESYLKRTEQNVIDSDGTLIVSHGKLTGGSELTLDFAIQYKKKLLHIDLNEIRGFSAAQLIKSWIIHNDIKILNVAGPHLSKDPDIYEDTTRLLKAVYHLFFVDSKKFDSGNLKPLYPRTVEQAVDRLFSELPFKDKTHIAKMEDNELELLHPILGKYILEKYGLGFKSSELLKDCRFMSKNSNLHEDNASAVIIKELWKKLRKTNALRVVKKKGEKLC